MKQTIVLITLAGVLASPMARADETGDAIKALRQQIEELDQKVRILERQKELEAEAAAAKAKEVEAKAKDVPRVTAGNTGLSVSSADTNFVFQLHGFLQVDNRSFFNDGDIRGNDGFLLRRARPIFQGTVYHDFDFMFTPDFGGSSVQIFDAYINYRYEPWLQLRAGKFKSPVGLEQMQSDPVTSFNERALPNDLMPNRDIGFQLGGDVYEGTLSYALGVFNGVGDGRNTANFDFEDHREGVARLFVQPFKKTELTVLKGLGFGIGGSWGITSSNATGLPATTGGTLPGYVTDGQQQFFAYNPTNGTVVANGVHWRMSPQAYYYYGPVGVLGEYAISNQRVTKGATSATLENTAWQVALGWVLTGEDASYTGFTPKKPFDLHKGTWGAFQIVGRYAQLNIDDDAFPIYSNPLTSADAAHAWALGLNWYLNKNIRINTSYSRTTFSGGSGSSGTATTSPGVVTRQPEEVFFTRLQIYF